MVKKSAYAHTFVNNTDIRLNMYLILVKLRPFKFSLYLILIAILIPTKNFYT